MVSSREKLSRFLWGYFAPHETVWLCLPTGRSLHLRFLVIQRSLTLFHPPGDLGRAADNS